jgi:hypothetical protein
VRPSDAGKAMRTWCRAGVPVGFGVGFSLYFGFALYLGFFFLFFGLWVFFGRVDRVFLWVLGNLLGWGIFGAGLGV